MDQLYDKYNHNTQKPTLRHANFKLMKKYDSGRLPYETGQNCFTKNLLLHNLFALLTGLEEEDLSTDTDDINSSDEENYPTAVYTVYNVHGEPIGHRLYSYQPVYEPEDDDIVSNVNTSEYEDSGELDDLSHVTVLKGGVFPDHKGGHNNAKSINKLKHEYFERYVDKRRKRFSTNKSEDNKKDINLELEPASAVQVTTTAVDTIKKSRFKRNVNMEESDREFWTVSPSVQDVDSLNEVTSNLLKVIPLDYNTLNETDRHYGKEMAVIPLQYVKTNSTEVDNILDKRDKRTSRKTDRLNQTTATVPKS